MNIRDEFEGWCKQVNLSIDTIEGSAIYENPFTYWAFKAYMERQEKIDALKAEIDRLMDAFTRIGVFLDMDFEACRNLPGKPSDVFIDAIKRYALNHIEDGRDIVLPTDQSEHKLDMVRSGNQGALDGCIQLSAKGGK